MLFYNVTISTTRSGRPHLANVQAQEVVSKTTHLTDQGERQTIRYLLDFGTDVAMNDKITVVSRKGLRGWAPETRSLTDTVQMADDQSGILPQTQALVFRMLR